MTKKSQTLLDRIRAIIDSDISIVEKASGKTALDGTTARKLCDYAKLEIALQRHDADLADAEAANELARQDYEAMLAQVRGLTTPAKEEDDS